MGRYAEVLGEEVKLSSELAAAVYGVVGPWRFNETFVVLTRYEIVKVVFSLEIHDRVWGGFDRASTRPKLELLNQWLSVCTEDWEKLSFI